MKNDIIAIIAIIIALTSAIGTGLAYKVVCAELADIKAEVAMIAEEVSGLEMRVCELEKVYDLQ